MASHLDETRLKTIFGFHVIGNVLSRRRNKDVTGKEGYRDVWRIKLEVSKGYVTRWNVAHVPHTVVVLPRCPSVERMGNHDARES